TVRLLPPRDVRPYVRRNKTDRADAAGLVEAARCEQIADVPVKSPRQQGLQALHRVRGQLKSQRTATINLVRGLLREYGVVIPNGSSKVRAAVLEALEDAGTTCRWSCVQPWPNSSSISSACKPTWLQSRSDLPKK